MSNREGKPQPSRQQADFFETEVLRLMDRLYGTALRLARDADDAEDLVAETISKAWACFSDLKDHSRFEGWLFQILSNTFMSEWRRRQSRRKLHTDTQANTPEEAEALRFSLFEKLHQPFLLWWGSAEDQFLNNLLREELEAALDTLPEEYRLVIVLVEVQGHTYSEVASMLEVPLGTIRSRLSRARGLLQKTLWEQARDAGLVTGMPGDPDARRGDE